MWGRHGDALPPTRKILYLNALKCHFLWLAKWCKIHKVYIHSHSRLLLLLMNIFIHIQQLSLHSRNIFVYIKQHTSYSRIYLLTFTGCIIHIQWLISVHIHDPNIDCVEYSFNIFCALPLCIIRSKLLSECKWQTKEDQRSGRPKTPSTSVTMARSLFLQLSISYKSANRNGTLRKKE